MKNKSSTKTNLTKKLNRERFFDKIVDSFENLIEDTVFDAPYYYVYRKFKYGWLNPRITYYNLKYGIQNLIRWFPVIWSDRDWDYQFWIVMNIKKLESMENTIRTYGIHLYCERDANNIKKAVLALKRLDADDYHENAFKNHDKKYGKFKMDFCPPDENGSRLCRFTRTKTTQELDIHYEEKASIRLHKHGEYMRKQDLEYATKTINKYLFHWWD